VLVFELPVIVLGLVSIGVLSSATLRRNRRLGYLIVAVVALGLPGPRRLGRVCSCARSEPALSRDTS
jgi:Sec-independent protein secretion pathway component TatC